MTADAIDNIPSELADLPQWCCWRKEKRRPTDDGPTKVPYDANTGRRAASNDPTTWASFSACLNLHRRGGFDGLGFFLATPYVGVDLDDCRDPESGAIVLRAAVLIEEFSTYSEVSRSMRGVKLIGKGSMATPDGRGKNYRRDPWGTGTGGIEFYGDGRFFALTGQRVPGTSAGVNDITAPLASLYLVLYPPAPPRAMRIVRSDVAESDRVKRARAYLHKLPPSVSGQGGHGRLLHAACTLLRFGLANSDALDLLHEYNRRAIPPWDDRDVARKLSEAHKVVTNFGALLVDREPRTFPHRRSVAFTVGAA